MTAIAGLIYAGGESTRFGGKKAEASLRGHRLIDHVAERLGPQVTTLAVAGPVHVTNATPLGDGVHVGKGPLAGLLAGLKWASDLPGVKWLVTTPCDVPLLPKNLVSSLSNNLTDKPTVLNVAGRWQAGCALWPTSVGPFIQDTLIKGEDLSLHRALRSLNVEAIEITSDALDGNFLNINTREDLIGCTQSSSSHQP
ncbi:molybdenum cofactor guanylyltransferase [Rhodobiaceae bacterium]|nr:molybdenum cofactor guanylyltransferase [Rhodobiaceae bacterium]